jgi:uroporphyrinogen decarboxylase
VNARERYLATLLFGEPDKVPLSPGGPRESTRRAWHEQGLPEGVAWTDHLMEVIGVEREATQARVPVEADFLMQPWFEEKVLEHRDGHYVVQDWMGNIVEISDAYDYTYIRRPKDFVTRKWHDSPAHNRHEWEERLKWRYDPDAPGRLPDDFAERCQAWRERDYPLSIQIPGPFWQMREWLGFEQLCYLMVDDPAFIDELAGFWKAFVSRLLERIVSQVQLDSITIAEDMAYKAHSMISPEMTRRWVLPSYAQWSDQLKASGCPVFAVDSDGNIATLLPLWIEAGVNCARPMEVAAGNDTVAYRKLYGRKMAYTGGIDKRAIAAGGEALRRAVMDVVPPLLEEGGYIPGCDHGVPPDISWPNFVEYTRLLAELTGWL